MSVGDAVVMEVVGGRRKRGCGVGTEWRSSARSDGCDDGVSLPFVDGGSDRGFSLVCNQQRQWSASRPDLSM